MESNLINLRLGQYCQNEEQVLNIYFVGYLIVKIILR